MAIIVVFWMKLKKENILIALQAMKLAFDICINWLVTPFQKNVQLYNPWASLVAFIICIIPVDMGMIWVVFNPLTWFISGLLTKQKFVLNKYKYLNYCEIKF